MAPGFQPGHAAAVLLHQPQSARLRAAAARASLRPVPGRRPALGVAALSLDRAAERLGRRQRRARRDPVGCRDERQYHLLLAPEDRPSGQNRGVVHLPLLLVLVPARAAARCHRHRYPGRPRNQRQAAALRGRVLERSLCRSARMADLKPMASTSAGTILALRTFASSSNKTFRVHFELDPGNQSLVELRLVLEQAGKAASETWLYRWTA